MLLNADIGFYSEPTFTSVKLDKLLDSFCENKVVVKYISGIKDKIFTGFSTCEDCKKVSIALPNGVLGFQAFYVLIENLIRNYFKYCHSEYNELKLDLKHINQGELKFNSEQKFVFDEYYCFEISHNPANPIDRKQWNRINKLIDGKIIENEPFQLRTEGLGFIEMKAFLLYLNGIDPENIDTAVLPNTNIKVFEIIPHDKCKENLTYRFWLRKPIDIRIPVSSMAHSKLEDGILFSTLGDRRNRYAPCFYYRQNESEEIQNNPSSYSPLVVEYSSKINSEENLVIDFLNKHFEIKNWNLEKYKILKFWDDKEQNLTIKENGLFTFDSTPIVQIKGNKVIAFDDHGKHLSSMNDYDFYQPFGGIGLGKLLNNLDKESFPALKHKVIEAFETRVVILDERIQRYGEKNIAEQYKYIL